MEIRKVGQALKTNNCDIQTLSAIKTPALLHQGHTVFAVNIQLGIRHDSDNRHLSQLLNHVNTRLQQSHITAEFIDNNPLDPLAVLRRHELNRSVDRGKDASLINIRH